MRRTWMLVLATALGSLGALAPSARGSLFNLAADWSSAVNPNGVWSYNQGAVPLPFMQANWAGTGSNAWTTTAAGISPPAWLFANVPFAGAAAGDVYVHSTNFTGTPARVTWTSPGAGTIDISGQAWNVDHAPGRDDEWTLSRNGTPIAFRSSVLGVAKNSANAQFANNLLPAQSLTGLAVNPGDIVGFEVRQTMNSFGHFTGVSLSINFVPEPSSWGLAVASLLAVVVGRFRASRRRRR